MHRIKDIFDTYAEMSLHLLKKDIDDSLNVYPGNDGMTTEQAEQLCNAWATVAKIAKIRMMFHTMEGYGHAGDEHSLETGSSMEGLFGRRRRDSRGRFMRIDGSEAMHEATGQDHLGTSENMPEDHLAGDDSGRSSFRSSDYARRGSRSRALYSGLHSSQMPVLRSAY